MVKVIDHLQTGKRKFIKGIGSKNGKKKLVWDPYNIPEHSKIHTRNIERRIKKGQFDINIDNPIGPVTYIIKDRFSEKSVKTHYKTFKEGKKVEKMVNIQKMYQKYGLLTDTLDKLKLFLEQRIKGRKVWIVEDGKILDNSGRGRNV